MARFVARRWRGPREGPGDDHADGAGCAERKMPTSSARSAKRAAAPRFSMAQALTSPEVEPPHFSFFSLERFDHASVILYQSRMAHGLTASTISSCTDASPIGCRRKVGMWLHGPEM